MTCQASAFCFAPEWFINAVAEVSVLTAAGPAIGFMALCTDRHQLPLAKSLVAGRMNR